MDDIQYGDIEKSLNKDSMVLSFACGNSMYPFLKNNTKILLSKTNTANLLDTVLYKTSNKYVLHRVIGIGKDNYIVLGDNCLKSESISKDSVLAVLSGYYKGSKYIEINDDINIKFFNISKRNKPFIKIKLFIKSLIK